MRSTLQVLLLSIGALALGGCAMGNRYNYAEVPVTMQGVSSAGAVAIAIADERPYVTSGNKTPQFVGLQRGGFGNPFDVNTASGRPLAEEMADALARAMKAKGADAVAVRVDAKDSEGNARRKLLENKPRRAVLITLHEWKTDTLMNTDFLYDVKLVVLDASGKQLAWHALKGTDHLGSLGLTPHEGISKATARKLDKLFDHDKVIEALK